MTDSPIVIVGGLFSDALFYYPLRHRLHVISRQPVYVVPIGLTDWLRGVRGHFGPLVDCVAWTVHRARVEHHAERVHLIGHSAGGLLSKLYLGDQPYHDVIYSGFRYTEKITTIATPNTGISGRTPLLSRVVQDMYPGTPYAPNVTYLSVAGRSVLGNAEGNPTQRRAFAAYRVLCGQGDVWGDGLIPVQSALLDGAEQIIIEGVRHGPLGSGRQRWFGSDIPTIMSWWNGHSGDHL